jgi:hypothetical protein
MHGTITGDKVEALDKHRLQMARDHFWFFRTFGVPVDWQMTMDYLSQATSGSPSCRPCR